MNILKEKRKNTVSYLAGVGVVIISSLLGFGMTDGKAEEPDTGNSLGLSVGDGWALRAEQADRSTPNKGKTTDTFLMLLL